MRRWLGWGFGTLLVFAFMGKVAGPLNPPSVVVPVVTERSEPTPWPTPYRVVVPAQAGVRIGASCMDGSHSSATGRGACSHHGGVGAWRDTGRPSSAVTVFCGGTGYTGNPATKLLYAPGVDLPLLRPGSEKCFATHVEAEDAGYVLTRQ